MDHTPELITRPICVAIAKDGVSVEDATLALGIVQRWLGDQVAFVFTWPANKDHEDTVWVMGGTINRSGLMDAIEEVGMAEVGFEGFDINAWFSVWLGE